MQAQIARILAEPGTGPLLLRLAARPTRWSGALGTCGDQLAGVPGRWARAETGRRNSQRNRTFVVVPAQDRQRIACRDVFQGPSPRSLERRLYGLPPLSLGESSTP
jgi:hypothetical protein